MNLRLLSAFLFAGCLLAEDFPRQWFFNAHNCYPDKGRGADRLERARRAGLTAIEIDVAWSEPRGRPVISHDNKLTGSEPTPEEYFFVPVLPDLRRMPKGQPGILLFLDFKSDHPGLVQQTYELLRRHQGLLSTFSAQGIDYRPLTVMLTGDNAAIAQFGNISPPGEPYLAMANREPPDRQFQEDLTRYFPEPATPFYRVFNFEWKHIERDPNNKAGAFTAAERARLRALVEMAHARGYWVRTWTLNATSRAWGTSQNFGSQKALLERWRAAQEAGVEMVATDEFEMAQKLLNGNR